MSCLVIMSMVFLWLESMMCLIMMMIVEYFDDDYYNHDGDINDADDVIGENDNIDDNSGYFKRGWTSKILLR